MSSGWPLARRPLLEAVMTRQSIALLLTIAGLAQGWHPPAMSRASIPRSRLSPASRGALRMTPAEGPDPDRFLNELEDALKHAVDLEQYDEAAKARQRLQDFMLERGDVNGVLNCNRDFYESFANGSVERMGAVWLKDDYVHCVHAGHKALRGYERIMAAFATQFRTVRNLAVNADDVRVTVRNSMAWVLCTQHMRHAPTGSHRALIATNIFRCQGGHWKLVHHHAGFMKSVPAVGQSLGGGFGGFGDQDGANGGIRIIDASSMGTGGSIDDLTGLIGRVMEGGSSGHQMVSSSLGGHDNDLLMDEMGAAEELCRATLHRICELGRAKAISARQKRMLITDVIENDGEECPAYIVRAFKLLCLDKNGDLVTDEYALDEFLVQCKLEARRLASSQERPRQPSREDSDVDDEIGDQLLD
mmetsp:Transcript_43688/g.101057  ORF Transcript_43688/g.101057 Transcript_43688/m.101057 type:complete len:417 (+) Transcript_43688:1-1251(+)